MKITKRQLRRIISEALPSQGVTPAGNGPAGNVSYEEMIQAINTNLGEALTHPPFAKYIYEEMVNGGWIE